MHRCKICDSTDHIDTLAAVGIYDPITNWYVTTEGYEHCNRCESQIQSVRDEYQESDELLLLDE